MNCADQTHAEAELYAMAVDALELDDDMAWAFGTAFGDALEAGKPIGVAIHDAADTFTDTLDAYTSTLLDAIERGEDPGTASIAAVMDVEARGIASIDVVSDVAAAVAA